MIPASIQNNDSSDLYVSVWDLNLGPDPVQIMTNQRINSDQQFGIAVQEDGDGNGKINWTTIGIDDPTISKSAPNVSLTANDTINVNVFGA